MMSVVSTFVMVLILILIFALVIEAIPSLIELILIGVLIMLLLHLGAGFMYGRSGMMGPFGALPVHFPHSRS